MRHTCRYLGQGQILTITDVLSLSLVVTCGRKVGRAELVEDLSML